MTFKWTYNAPLGHSAHFLGGMLKVKKKKIQKPLQCLPFVLKVSPSQVKVEIFEKNAKIVKIRRHEISLKNHDFTT